eukprot:TRINITY_DN36131_c0_g1_i1.p1 TRINITY_DN36131_c0_g1~~TRINITY_DN36131_c0_g1_i1.p1  ORF type:complete len:124 (-),score=31.12 TRINITY_DN36131_c0_g1_i1:112-483(-)
MVFPNADEFRLASGKPVNDDSIGENDSTLSWEDVRWLVSKTKLPLICKGILSAEDARQAVVSGARGLIVSNHGCRQMDGTPANIDVLPSVVEAVRAAVSYTHLRAHETPEHLVCRLLLEKKNK